MMDVVVVNGRRRPRSMTSFVKVEKLAVTPGSGSGMSWRSSGTYIRHADSPLAYAELHAHRFRRYAVGTVPPSILYSVPVIAPARGETRKAIKSATSCGFTGRPSGMPPSASMMIFLPPS